MRPTREQWQEFVCLLDDDLWLSGRGMQNLGVVASRKCTLVVTRQRVSGSTTWDQSPLPCAGRALRFVSAQGFSSKTGVLGVHD
jgi:hypothetical protein